jgi:manganese/zinc/iron transport system substrate-binding protein
MTRQLHGFSLCCVTLLFLAVWVLAGCGGDAPAENVDDGRYTIVATVGMIADVARHVAGEHARIESIMSEGIDPHLYKPTRGDVIRLESADIVFYNGLYLEGKMAEVLEKVRESGKPVFAVGEMIGEGGYGLASADQHYDPHLWMDVSAWIVGLRAIADSLAEYDPANAAEYRANADQYESQLRELDTYARRVIESIPERKRVLVTAHDAFGYMGAAYGLEVRGIQGISTESEAGLRHINELIDFLIEREIPAVFVESSVADKNVRALVEGAAARGHAVSIGGSLFSDAMGRPGTYEGTYIGMIDHNVTTIARALGGEAPSAGMQGKLASHIE